MAGVDTRPLHLFPTDIMKKKLYRITAHGATREDVYYVVSEGSSAAEQAVERLHSANGWFAIDYYTAETMAEESDNGKPMPLIIAEQSKP
jgi:hypothetical protein